MLNAVSNPIGATSSEAATTAPVASPLSALFENPVSSGGQPAFAQAVHDAMNNIPSNAIAQPNISVNTNESSGTAVSAQSSTSGPPAKASSAKSSIATKQISQSIPQLTPSTANCVVNLSQLLVPALSIASPVATPQTQIASTPTSLVSEDATDTSGALADSSRQTLMASLPTSAAAHLLACLTQPSPSPSATDFQSVASADIRSAANTCAQTSTQSIANSSPLYGSLQADEATPTNDVTPSNNSTQPSAPQLTASVANSDSLSSVFSPNFLFVDAGQPSRTGAEAPVPSPSDKTSSAPMTSAPESSSATQQKPDALPQSAASSLNLTQSGLLSKLVDQVAALQSTAPTNSGVPVVATRFLPASPQALANTHATDPTLSISSLPRALSASATKVVSSANEKQIQPASIESHLPNPAQSLASTTNQNSSSQDSSSNPRNQSSFNSSSAALPSTTQPSLSKNQTTDVSAQVAILTAPKPDPATAAQAAMASTTPNTSAAPISAQQLDANSHSSQESLPSSPTQAQSTIPSVHVPDSPLLHQVNDAQLSHLNGQIEMRIELQTDKLGAIELHARVSGDELGAAITVEKHDAHAALAVELPALQQSLSEKQLRVTQVALTQGSLSSTTGDAGASAQHNHRGAPQSPQTPQTASFWNDARILSTAAWFVHEPVGVFNSQGRLSVQA